MRGTLLFRLSRAVSLIALDAESLGVFSNQLFSGTSSHRDHRRRVCTQCASSYGWSGCCSEKMIWNILHTCEASLLIIIKNNSMKKSLFIKHPHLCGCRCVSSYLIFGEISCHRSCMDMVWCRCGWGDVLRVYCSSWMSSRTEDTEIKKIRFRPGLSFASLASPGRGEKMVKILPRNF